MRAQFVPTQNAKEFLARYKALEQRGANEACTVKLLPGDSGILTCSGTAFVIIGLDQRATPTQPKTAAYTAVLTDFGKFIDCTGTWTLTLTAAATLGDGWWCEVRNSGTGVITIDPNGAELINGAATVKLLPGDSGILTCSGTAFVIIGLDQRATPTQPKTAAYTAVLTDFGKFIDCTGTWTLTLTAAATLGDGWWCEVRNSGTGVITIDPNAAELIDDATAITLGAGESCTINCTSTAFKTIGRTAAQKVVNYAEILLAANSTPGAALATILSGSYTPLKVGSTVVVDAIYTYNNGNSYCANNHATFTLDVGGASVASANRSEAYGWMGGNQTLSYRYTSDGTAKALAMKHSATYGPTFYAGLTLFRIWEFA